MNAAKAGFPAMRFRDLAGVVAITLAVLMASLPRTRAEGGGDRTIIFVCQHGVVNSQMAAAYFNKAASERGLPYTAVSRGIDLYPSVPVRLDSANLKYEVTIDDKGAYTKPWSAGWNIRWQYENYDGSPGGEIHEYFCIDNERDAIEFAAQ